MGIDYAIAYGCVPKEVFTTEGLLNRLKGGERAQTLIDFYRNNGDMRPESEMGGEFMRRSADGEEETVVLYVDDLLAQHAELDAYTTFCEGCPANALKRPFGCIGNINYPISQAAEVWLLQQLPSPDEPMPFLLLTKAEEFGLTGATARQIRDNVGVIFETPDTLGREYPEMTITADQLFELMFLLGTIQPKRAHMILMYAGALARNLEAGVLMQQTPAPPDALEKHPFLLRPESGDDRSISDLKRFFYALYTAWALNRDMTLDV